MQVILEQVAETVEDVMGCKVAADEPLMAAGLDSLGSVELRNSLEGRMGVQLPSTLVFDYPSISALVTYLATKVHNAPADTAAARTEVGSDQVPADAGTIVGLPSDLPLHVKRVPVALVAAAFRTPDCMAGSGIKPVDSITRIPYKR